MIQPTIGRIVWFYPDGMAPGDQPLAAIITRVHTDRCVNLSVFTPDGTPVGRTSATLVQEGDEPPPYSHARWMPYQLGQARTQASTSYAEAVSAQAGAATPIADASNATAFGGPLTDAQKEDWGRGTLAIDPGVEPGGSVTTADPQA